MERDPSGKWVWNPFIFSKSMEKLAKMASSDKSNDNTSSAIKSIVADVAAKLDCPLQPSSPATSGVPARPGPQRYLYATGPYALELWYPGDDIHLVCFTDNSPKTFWPYVSEKLQDDGLPQNDCPVAELPHGGKLWLHYCPLPGNFEPAVPSGLVLPKISKSILRSDSAAQSLRSLHDTWHLLEFVGIAAPVFKRAYALIRTFVISAGLYSAKLGTLDADSLLWMLFRIVPSSLPANRDDAHTLLKAFFATYLDVPSLHLVHTPSGRKVFNPPPHIANDASVRVARQIWNTNGWAQRLSHSPEQHLREFISNHWALALVSAECWVPKQCSDFQDNLISRISRFPKAIHDARLTRSAVSIWPYAFRPSDDEWIYLIGIEEKPTPRLLDHIGMEKHFVGDASDVSLEETEKVDWNDVTPNRALELMLELYDFRLNDMANTSGHVSIYYCKPATAMKLLDNYGAPDPLYTLKDVPRPSTRTGPGAAHSSKLPSAGQALNRLRWDPAHAAYRYEVGYLDRFEGMMWLPFEQWGKATEDDEFIPEHRIRILRRKHDGKNVWDREARVCDL